MLYLLAHSASFLYVLSSLQQLVLQTQSISGTRTLQMGEASAISSSKIRESKARERRRENSGLRAGLYSPL